MVTPSRSRLGFDFGARLFDVPVYRVSPERWREERDEEIARWVDDSWLDTELIERQKRRFNQLFMDQHGGYPYSQIIGWVHVAWVGHAHVKCYYFRVSTSRIGRHFRQGRFANFGKIAEISLSGTSVEMMSEIRRALVCQTQVSGYLRGRFLDLEVFDNLAPFVDLRTLMRLGELPSAHLQGRAKVAES